jgi:hypothetical protein
MLSVDGPGSSPGKVVSDDGMAELMIGVRARRRALIKVIERAGAPEDQVELNRSAVEEEGMPPFYHHPRP